MPCAENVIGCAADAAGGLAGDIAGGLAGGIATSAWESVCQSFAEAATTLLKAFAKAFAAFPDVNPLSDGVKGVYAISLGIAIVVGGALFLWQVARTVITHEGAPFAYALVGLGKALLAFLATLTVTSAAVMASNDLTDWIINASFEDIDGLQEKIATVFTFEGPGQSASLVLILALIGIILTLVLWFELLLSSAAVAVLIGTSPIAASGQISEATKAWWPKLVSATIQLILLKPVIALVFAVGFGVTGEADDLGTLLAGMMILLLSVLAWPAIARFFTFAQVSVGGGAGLAAALGVAAGRSGDLAGATAGVAPDQFARTSEARTMSAVNARSGGHGGSGGGGKAASGGAAGGAAGGGLSLASAGLGLAQRAANSLVGRMEQTASHAGLDRANPHPAVAGYPGHAARWPGAQGGDNEDLDWMNASDRGQDNGNHTGAPGAPDPAGPTGPAGSGAGINSANAPAPQAPMLDASGSTGGIGSTEASPVLGPLDEANASSQATSSAQPAPTDLQADASPMTSSPEISPDQGELFTYPLAAADGSDAATRTSQTTPVSNESPHSETGSAQPPAPHAASSTATSSAATSTTASNPTSSSPAIGSESPASPQAAAQPTMSQRGPAAVNPGSGQGGSGSQVAPSPPSVGNGPGSLGSSSGNPSISDSSGPGSSGDSTNESEQGR
ncbi:hypothetical protein [Kineosporia sp. NBRC 101731]|uniref:hypothetical protein n=1 Tax=Kineosporia sp. NBRC 101731 TaxID=3032199 RepID=UPI0024A29877|nr:hypothetical protein [Kineosporia sp. NBRC 101731]GLY33409.1 hypothetical protein Kisp02_67740 [Kineosporia sp. NBRC 101731]